jgi:sporulation integral membrane protein YtvI
VKSLLPLYKKYWRTAFDIGIIALTVWLVLYVFSFLYRIATPVFLAFVIFWLIEPLAGRLHRMGLRKSFASGISVLLFTVVVLALVLGLGYIFAMQIEQLQHRLPTHSQIQAIAENLQERANSLPPDIAVRLKDAAAFVADAGAWLAKKFLGWLVSFLSSFSTFVFNFSIAIILAYFLSVEIDSWRRLSAERAPKTLKLAFAFLRDNVFRGIAAYFKAQAKLVSVTFAVILVALLLLKVDNAFAIALLAGLFDVLPVLGVGTLFVPWIVYLFVTGDFQLGLCLTGLLLLVTLTRQFLEPRITGQTIGVSAFTMLAFMMVSLSLFGVAGMILAPVLMILLKALYDQGYLQQWIRLPKEEFAVSPLAPRPPDDPEDPEEP